MGQGSAIAVGRQPGTITGMDIDRYAVNDALTELCGRFNVELDDDTLNELTHHVADTLEGQTSSPPSAHRPVVEWAIDVFDDLVTDIHDPRQVAQAGYDLIVGHDMPPVLTVHLPDGRTVNVDLDD